MIVIWTEYFSITFFYSPAKAPTPRYTEKFITLRNNLCRRLELRLSSIRVLALFVRASASAPHDPLQEAPSNGHLKYWLLARILEELEPFCTMEPISKMWLLLTPPQKFDTNYYNITTRAIFAKSFQNDLSSTHMELTVLDPIWFGFMQPLYIAKEKKNVSYSGPT